MDEAEAVEAELRAWLSGAPKLVVVGVGNPLRRDDAVGVVVVRRLREGLERSGGLPSSVELVEAEAVPENLMGPIMRLRPSHILIIDAAHHDGPPGSVMLVGPDALGGPSFSTHAPSLRLFCSFLERAIGAKSLVIGIRPLDTGFGEGLTEQLDRAADMVADMLVRLLSRAGR